MRITSSSDGFRQLWASGGFRAVFRGLKLNYIKSQPTPSNNPINACCMRRCKDSRVACASLPSGMDSGSSGPAGASEQCSEA